MAKGRAPLNAVTGLTAQQEQFCFQSIRLGDHNRAYRVAYDASGMQQSSVRAAVSRLLENTAIAQRQHELQAAAEARLGVSIERIARELARIGFSDMGDLYDDAGQPFAFHLLPKDIRRCVKSVTIVERRGGMMITLDGKPVDRKRKKGETAEALLAQGLQWVPIREKKVELHDKLGALQTMARWKKMIQDKGEDGSADPNDPRGLTDEQLEAEIRANQAALDMIDRARKRSKVKKPAESKS